jgi:hypothetical protein
MKLKMYLIEAGISLSLDVSSQWITGRELLIIQPLSADVTTILSVAIPARCLIRSYASSSALKHLDGGS